MHHVTRSCVWSHWPCGTLLESVVSPELTSCHTAHGHVLCVIMHNPMHFASMSCCCLSGRGTGPQIRQFRAAKEARISDSTAGAGYSAASTCQFPCFFTLLLCRASCSPTSCATAAAARASLQPAKATAVARQPGPVSITASAAKALSTG